MPEKHTRMTPNGRALWWTERLWALTAGLPVRKVAIADIPEFEQDCWFGEKHAATIRLVAEHARRIQAADLNYPVILSADGRLMDGGHRLSKAWLLGHTHIDAVQFETDPAPDEILPA